MSMIRLLDARRGLYRKCEELFRDAKIAEAIYRYLCDGIEECEDVSHQQWIPVTERLPKKDGQYYVTVKEWHKDPYVMIARFYKSFYSCGKTFYNKFVDGDKLLVGLAKSGDKVLTNTVTAWMSLPEPYRPEGGKE